MTVNKVTEIKIEIKVDGMLSLSILKKKIVFAPNKFNSNSRLKEIFGHKEYKHTHLNTLYGDLVSYLHNDPFFKFIKNILIGGYVKRKKKFSFSMSQL